MRWRVLPTPGSDRVLERSLRTRDDVDMTEATTERFESDAEFLRALPITTFSSSGKLQLAGGRLSFTTGLRHRVLFDVPVNELHSVARSAVTGLHLWHGSTRYRLSVGSPVYIPGVGTAAAEAVTGLPLDLRGRFEMDRANRATADNWLQLLQEHQTEPPAGLKVRRPWPTWAIWLTVVGVTLVLVGAITANALLAG